ncbi:cobalamin biosynthesis protein CobG [Sphingomonas phyllosphaerae]|uniref:cobalamin biosynthesis protein CobG n=1 Tax=Sphingomonas phyllosphaerae TaxID=257003 RepID=UPI00041BE398|nr:cobalamin biosynthesis protein CobG [Sphingomonas phyllosphaerae]
MSATRGWCPTAWRPMAAGDGLLVRVRPALGRLTRDQMLGLCAAALVHGNGQIDVTNRANLQIRGATEASWRLLLAELVALRLVDPDPQREARRTILLAPDWTHGDDTHRIADELERRIAMLPPLPGKFGFAIDAGHAPLLTASPADVRIERTTGGALMLRAEGRATGTIVAPGAEVDALIAIADWFVATGGRDVGRMARHVAPLPGWANGEARPAPPSRPVAAGGHPLGAVHPLAFGRIDVPSFAASLSAGATAVRTTPWRCLLIEGDDRVPAPDALAAVDACVGAPACPQATIETRALATRLAPAIVGTLHVSGCAKGCARAAPAAVVLTGRDGRYDLARDARADAPPARCGLDARHVLQLFGVN